MYGNTQFGADVEEVDLTPEQRQSLRRDLTHVAAGLREVLPGEFVVGSEITSGSSGPRATIAVQPPLGSVVSAGYSPTDDKVEITDDERDDLVHGLAASAALQVKQAMTDDAAPTAQ
ncbi:hypothetical protein GOC74_06800 [Halomicrobium mukohataei]|uniref:Uncharacterized protein n=1 Tax=Halomicrobium mukohataei TaxID=57705 RepID=A0A847UAV8_9EURY|nr:DUF5811 family protein [Halomicrobium mukohataei]NLV09636.1 hypothetical protein [Halomicrobium mukohataei]